MARTAFKTVALAGATAGVLDGVAAVVTSSAAPQRVFQYIASGVLGRAAFEGGWSSVALGVFFHFLIATGAAAVFYLASRRWPNLLRHPMLSGVVYGVAVYFFMRFVVMALSAVAFPAFSFTALVRGLVVHVLCVGLPIAFCVRFRAASDLVEAPEMTLHKLLDFHYGAAGDVALRRMLKRGANPNLRAGLLSETPLHVATRRRRAPAVKTLLDHGAEIDAITAGGKTAYAHAVRRGFAEVAELLQTRGANTDLNGADRLAVALVNGRLADAREILAKQPSVARTGNPEEDRLLADLAGRDDPRPVALLIQAGADLEAPGLDTGTPLHQAAWFGQPENARLLIDAGAALDVFEPTHESSPIGWAVHGSRYSGGAATRQDAYVALARMLLEAGSSLRYPGGAEGDGYFRRLMGDATPRVRKVLEEVSG